MLRSVRTSHLKADLSDSEACPSSSTLDGLGPSRSRVSSTYRALDWGKQRKTEVQIQDFCQRDSSDHYFSCPEILDTALQILRSQAPGLHWVGMSPKQGT